MVVVDTTVWVDYFNGFQTPETDWLDFALERQRLAITPLILCEVLQGLRTERAAADVRTELLRLELLDGLTPEVAIAAAAGHRLLRRRGITVRKTIDLLIATFCIEAQHTLLHNDRDYDSFEQYLGLSVVHP
ncbi:MAG TPA: PIN domain-containing protein [Vicinamibacterales bacterium]